MLDRAAAGASIADLAASLVDDEIDLDAARGYIGLLIDTALLIPVVALSASGAAAEDQLRGLAESLPPAHGVVAMVAEAASALGAVPQKTCATSRHQ